MKIKNPQRGLATVSPAPESRLAPTSGSLPNLTASDLEDIAALGQHFQAENSKKALESDWKLFEEFCDERNEPSLPAKPEVVAAYLTALNAGKVGGRCKDLVRKFFPRKLATIERHLSTISTKHTMKGLLTPREHPFVKATLKAIARSMGDRSKKVGKRALTFELLEPVLHSLPVNEFRIRDAALLGHGFHSGGRRRSELVVTDIEDVRVTREVTYVNLNRSKTDQVGKGVVTRIPRNGTDTCPAAAIDALLAELRGAGFTKGPLYRRIVKGKYVDERMAAAEVALVVKAGAERTGLDPSLFSGHSLRSGFITSAVETGVGIFDIQIETGHKTTESLKGYVQAAVAKPADLASSKIVARKKTL